MHIMSAISWVSVAGDAALPETKVRSHTLRVMLAIGALLKSDSEQRLRAAVPYTCTVISHSRPCEMITRIARREVDLVVLDPMVLNHDGYDAVLESIRVCCVDLILWTSHLTPQSGGRILHAQGLPVRLLISAFDDADRLLRRIVRQDSDQAAMVRVGQLLAPGLRCIRQEISIPVIGVQAGARVPRSVLEFVEAARLSRRTVERELLKGRLGRPKRLLDVLRAARAWPYVSQLGLSMGEVSLAAGYHSERAMVERFRAMVDLPPRRARRSITSASFACLLHTHLVSDD